MSISLNENSKIIVQGMTGSEGHKHATRMLAYDTKIMAGINPKEVGTNIDFGITPYGSLADQLQDDTVSIPAYGTVAKAKATTDANTSVIFVSPVATKGTVLKAVDAGLDLVVVITEHVLVRDASFALAHARERGVRVTGPNCPGIISPSKSNVGITPRDIIPRGHLGSMSKSGTLTYQMMYELCDLGFTTCIGIGGDPIIGTTHIDALTAFEQDPEAKLIVMIGEIGGDVGERVAAYIKECVTKPVAAYVVGFTALEGRAMGHAGAIVSDSSGTAAAKRKALGAVGIKVGKTPSETARIAHEIVSAR